MMRGFATLKSRNPLKDKKGRRFGYIKIDDCRILIDHWNEGKQYYTQWSMMEEGRYRNIGTAHSYKEPITVYSSNRTKHIQNEILSKFPEIDMTEVNLLLSEIVEMANELGVNLYPTPESDTVEEEEGEEIILGFNDYPENLQNEAMAIFEDNPLEYIMKTLDLVHYGDEETKEILILVLFTKHVTNGKPVSVVIVGTTESGKTSLANKTARITPERYRIDTSSMSSKAAFYHQDSFREDYNHLIINDFLDSPEAIGTLKALTDTELESVKHMTVSDDKKAVTLEVKGKNTIIVTAARQLTDRELNRRLLHLNPDESDEHQNETKEFIIEGEIGLSDSHEHNFEVSQALYDKIIEKDYEVFVPWILDLKVEMFSKTDIKQFTNLVKARTIIYRANRNEITDSVLLASLEDMKHVAELWGHIGEMQKTYLPAKAFDMIELLPEYDEYKVSVRHYGKNIKEIAQELDVSRETVNRWLWGESEQRGMVDLGYIYAEKNGDSHTSPWILYKPKDTSLETGFIIEEASALPSSEMFKGMLKKLDKRKIILSVCNLFISYGCCEDVDKKELVDSIFLTFDKEIETDSDIMDICDLVKEKLKKFSITSTKTTKPETVKETPSK